MNTSLPTNVTAGTADLPGMLNTTHGAVNELSADTGWRNATGLLISGWTVNSGGYVHVRRVAGLVQMRIRGLNGSAATGSAFLRFAADPAASISSTFNPGQGYMSPLFLGVDATEFWRMWVSESNGLCASVGRTYPNFDVYISWMTDRAWPSFLPPAVA